MKPWTTQAWMYIKSGDLQVELNQCKDEGKDLSKLQGEFDALMAADLDNDLSLQVRTGRLLDKTAKLRPASGYAFKEPSDLPSIQRARRGRVKMPPHAVTDAMILEKVTGAWVGRAAGCLLGKPVEGRRREEIQKYLEAQGRFPLNDYFSNQVDDAVRQDCHFLSATNACYKENITCMVEDDDTNYTTIGLAVVEKYGKDFTPADVATFWLDNLPILHTFTAERVAYANFIKMMQPPAPDGTVDGPFSSATYRNVYREWIGAQIRADFFGYANPANPERAAAWAWRDACISHIKNGIYGEMWAAAMLAAAYVISDDVEKVIRAGMGEIPSKCRLHADLEEVFAWRKAKLDYRTAINKLHTKWDQRNSHHWCHTNSNAQIVALALLWGELDYGKTICYAVMPGFDTDCNGATAGSVLGMMLGGSSLPSQWTAPMNDKLLTGVAGYHEVKLTAMAKKTLELVQRDR